MHLNREKYNIFVFEGKRPEITIFNNMKKYFLNEKVNTMKEKVAVLSAFPMFLVDYYGTKRFKQ